MSKPPESSRNPSPSPSEDSKLGRAWEAAQMSSVGIEMAVATCIGWAIGYWLDSRLGTEPWLMLVGLGFGITAGFRGLLRAARKANRRFDASNS